MNAKEKYKLTKFIDIPIKSLWYCYETKELVIVFKRVPNKVFIFHDIPAEIYEEFSKHHSPMIYYHNVITKYPAESTYFSDGHDFLTY